MFILPKLLVYVFPERKRRGLVPYFHIHVSVCDLHIPTSGPPILQQIGGHECGNWEPGRAVSFLGIFLLIFGVPLQCVYLSIRHGERNLAISWAFFNSIRFLFLCMVPKQVPLIRS
jgi:hypothetical protein